MEKKEVWDAIQKHWKEIRTLYKENYNVKDVRLRTYLGKDYLPLLDIIDKPTRNKSEYLEVKFEDGEEFSSNNESSDSEVLKEVIERAGIEKVEKLDIETPGGNPFIIDDLFGNTVKGYKKCGKKLFFIKTGVQRKRFQIESIINKLQLKAKVEIVKR